MIARLWRGWTRSAEADRYDRHYRLEVLPTLGKVPGFRGARLLRRTAGGETAVVAEEAREILVRFDERVSHYQIAVEA